MNDLFETNKKLRDIMYRSLGYHQRPEGSWFKKERKKLKRIKEKVKCHTCGEEQDKELMELRLYGSYKFRNGIKKIVTNKVYICKRCLANSTRHHKEIVNENRR